MARSPFTWGIDVGKCALKALRCRLEPGEPRRLVAEAFDYVEYPKLLTQPDADPVELVQAALAEFTGRNDLAGSRVALAVPGQFGLSKFIKLPPIEAKKIPDIVRYEARQQIPFPLEQVVWDWQRLAGGMEEGGFVIDAEVAIFAMKRDQVTKALAPLIDAGVEVDILQLSPIALANMAAFDQLPPVAGVDPEKPPASVVIVSMGVDTTDIVVTNGCKIGQRSIPIGGSSFTKAMVRDLQLTFAKAEHLKRNAVRAEDPKAVYKAMRPVFNEFAAELQKSLTYFAGNDRTLQIGKVLMLGNAAKLRGLTDFVAKQLQLDVQRLDTFKALEGAGVTSAPAYRENRLAFGTAYGLALQGCGGATIDTSLMPREIVVDRLVAEKKPWAVGAMVGLTVAALVNFVGLFLAWKTYADTAFDGAFSRVDAVQGRSQAATAEVEDLRAKREAVMGLQRALQTVHERRFQALDLFRALGTLLPRDTADPMPENPADRRELHIDAIDCEFFPDLAAWFAAVRPMWEVTHGARDGAGRPNGAAEPGSEPAAAEGAAVEGTPVEGAPDAAAGVAEDAAGPAGPTGPGWVIQIAGHHFHNEDRHKPEEDEQFLRSTLVHNLAGDGEQVVVSAGPLAGQKVSPRDIGIGFPVIVSSSPVRRVSLSPSRPQGDFLGPGGAEPRGPGPRGALPGAEGEGDEEVLELRRYDFVVQFVWQPRAPGVEPAAADGTALPADSAPPAQESP